MPRKRQLFIFVEGRTDTRFFKSVAVPKLRVRYKRVDIIEYASMRSSKFANWMRSAKRMGADVLFIHDFDTGPDYKTLRRQFRQRFRGIKSNSIYIVKIEIESWYLAGLSESNRKRFKMDVIEDTEVINKEAFLRLKPKGKQVHSASGFMIELLKDFNLRAARRRNTSFAYFYGRVLAQHAPS